MMDFGLTVGKFNTDVNETQTCLRAGKDARSADAARDGSVGFPSPETKNRT